jgi:microcystin-dependent protein
MCSRNRDYFDLNAHQRPMVGDTKTSALTIDHLGWLVCDGRLLDVSTWQFLFKAVGYSFGSNVSGTQFKLPDPAGRVVGFVGNNGSVDASGNPLTTRAMGSNAGNENHTLTVAQMPTHNHGITDPGHSHTGTTNSSSTGITLNDPTHTHGYVQPPNNNHENATSLTNSANNSGVLAGTTSASSTGITLTDPTHTHAFTTGSSLTGVTTNNNGSSNAHNNMQPTLFLGNLFIYSGKPFYANYPFTAGTNLI